MLLNDAEMMDDEVVRELQLLVREARASLAVIVFLATTHYPDKISDEANKIYGTVPFEVLLAISCGKRAW